MDEIPKAPEFRSAEEPFDPAGNRDPAPPGNQASAASAPFMMAPEGSAGVVAPDAVPGRKLRFRRNLSFLLGLALAAFIFTSWLLVRVDVPFAEFSAGPQEIVRAQLRAVDRGELRPAYDMFSARYRGQVSFDAWHQLVVTHWRMFHSDVVRVGQPSASGPAISLELYLHGADDRDYRARFTLIRTDGRWWIDDVHWVEERNARDFSRA